MSARRLRSAIVAARRRSPVQGRVTVLGGIGSAVVAGACALAAAGARQPAVATTKSFEQGLADTLDRYHHRLDVYSDAFAGGNHFAVRACMGPTANFCARRPDA